jgi:hypothetical protein
MSGWIELLQMKNKDLFANSSLAYVLVICIFIVRKVMDTIFTCAITLQKFWPKWSLEHTTLQQKLLESDSTYPQLIKCYKSFTHLLNNSKTTFLTRAVKHRSKFPMGHHNQSMIR